MDAVLVREAGGLGDVLQIGSAAPLLRKIGYNTHFYTLADPAIVELANLIRGIDMVHPLRISISQRRERGDKSYHKFPYLSAPLAHASLTDARQSWNRLYDLFCPAWLIERDDAKRGLPPRLSRAQAFVEACGFDPAKTRPARVVVPERQVVQTASEQLKSKSWTFVCLWSRDPARSIPGAMGDLLVRSIARKYGPTVTFNFPEGACDVTDQNVFRYPDDLDRPPSRVDAVGDILALISSAKRVVTVDTLALHVAGSLGKPIVLLAGPTIPETVASHYQKVTSWQPDESLECRGCYYLQNRGFDKATCRNEGCKVLRQVNDDRLLGLIGEAGEACVRS